MLCLTPRTPNAIHKAPRLGRARAENRRAGWGRCEVTGGVVTASLAPLTLPPPLPNLSVLLHGGGSPYLSSVVGTGRAVRRAAHRSARRPAPADGRPLARRRQHRPRAWSAGLRRCGRLRCPQAVHRGAQLRDAPGCSSAHRPLSGVVWRARAGELRRRCGGLRRVRGPALARRVRGRGSVCRAGGTHRRARGSAPDARRGGARVHGGTTVTAGQARRRSILALGGGAVGLVLARGGAGRASACTVEWCSAGPGLRRDATSDARRPASIGMRLGSISPWRMVVCAGVGLIRLASAVGVAPLRGTVSNQ
jgi:hypothetical protein